MQVQSALSRPVLGALLDPHRPLSHFQCKLHSLCVLGGSIVQGDMASNPAKRGARWNDQMRRGFRNGIKENYWEALPLRVFIS